MEKEDKELLFKDLCTRLPYGVKVQHQHQDYLEEVQTVEHISRKYGEIETNSVLGFVDDFKPYLRPMSSMTREEVHEFQDILGSEVEVGFGMVDIIDYSRHTFSFLELQALFDWLLKHHFDFMGLIPMDLAIAVTEENNPYK